MDMFLNNSIPEIEEFSQTNPIHLSLDEDSLDMLIRVHRFDPIPGSKLYVTFLYPPTNVTLRVLMLEDFRPTYKMMISQSSLVTKHSPYYSPNYQKSKSNSFYYMGVLPGPGLPLSHSVPFSFTINSTACVAWERVKWDSTGCNIGPNTIGHKIHCQCNHLSIFGAIFPYLPNEIDPFKDAKLFLTVLDNSLVVSIMAIILISYIIFTVIAYKLDKKDRFRGVINVLEDNFPDDEYPYVLAVYTSSRLFCGTSANVGVQIIGELANSRAHILKSSYYKVLTRQSDDWFIILCPKPLGSIRFLHIWHDNNGNSPDWYCEKVVLFDIKNNLECLFILEQWIETNLTDYSEVLVAPASNVDISKIKRILCDNISKSVKEQRFAAGIFTQHPRNTVKRVARVNISTCRLLFVLLCSIMFYIDPNTPKPDNYVFVIRKRDLYVSIIAVGIIIAIGYIVNLLFQKSYRFVPLRNNCLLYLRRDVSLEEYLDLNAKESKSKWTTEENKDNPLPENKQEKPGALFKKKFALKIQNIMENRKLAPAVLPQAPSPIKVVKVWLVTSWTISILIIVTCTYFISLYGLKMGIENSKIWLTSILFSYVHNKTIISPLSIILMAIVFTAISEYSGASKSYRATENEILNAISDTKHKSYEFLTKERRRPMYSPITIDDRNKLLRKKQRFYFGKNIYIVVTSLCYLFTVFSIMEEKRELYFYRHNHLQSIIVGKEFFKAYNIKDFIEYFEETFSKGIFNNYWYNMWPLIHGNLSLYWTSDLSWKMLGSPYIRQQRVHEVPCHSIASPSNLCVPCLSSGTKDTDSYAIGWSTPLKTEKSMECDNPWCYIYATESRPYTYFRLLGKSGLVYDNGGYRTGLGNSIQEYVGRVTHLFDNNWMNTFTKVVFMEVTLYNVNVHSLAQATLIIEILTSGVSLKTVRTKFIAYCHAVTFREVVFTVLTFLLFLETVCRLNYHGFILMIRDISSIILLVLVILSVFVIIVLATSYYNCNFQNIWERFYEEEYDHFFLDALTSSNRDIEFIISFLLLLSAWRTLLLVRALNIFLVTRKLFGMTLGKTLFLVLLTFICLIFLQQISVLLDSAFSNFIALLIAPKEVLLPKSSLGFEYVFYSCIRFCTSVFISSLFVTIYVHFNPKARYASKKTPSLRDKLTVKSI